MEMKEEGDAGERMECEGREEMRGRGHRREGGLQGVGVGLTVGGGELCSGMMQHGTHRGGHTLHTHAHTPYTATHLTPPHTPCHWWWLWWARS